MFSNTLQMMNCNAAKVFSYREIKVATRNFKQALGRGSFGSVYLGKLPDGKLIAVKVRSGGSLTENLYDSRLPLMLHNRSEPRIIHCDVKSSNILMDEDLNAKICDFGLSKQVTQADASHVTTMVKGTAGYLDPEYFTTQQLTEKSDVYSFGVVLLELICGRAPLTRTGSPDSFNLVLWARPYLQAGAFEIVDESLKGTYDEESMRITASIASRSVDRDASQRPNISEVVAVLKESYSIQLSYLATVGLPT